MTEHRLPTDDDVDELLETINTDEWAVTDWELETGEYDPVKMTISVEWTPGQDVVELVTSDQIDGALTIKDVIERINESTAHGAPITDVVRVATDEMDLDAAAVKDEITRLKKNGEVYEPAPDHLRTT